mmetsp:Transcript_34765/g.35344  ORF Transcript_34765/g.35344 Transcript_34765/m.35344 type:complete len:99 (+) Transcript_34765:139-435(+)
MHGDDPVLVQNWLCNDIRKALSFSEARTNTKLDLHLHEQKITSYPLYIKCNTDTQLLSKEKLQHLNLPNHPIYMLNQDDWYEEPDGSFSDEDFDSVPS